MGLDRVQIAVYKLLNGWAIDVFPYQCNFITPGNYKEMHVLNIVWQLVALDNGMLWNGYQTLIFMGSSSFRPPLVALIKVVISLNAVTSDPSLNRLFVYINERRSRFHTIRWEQSFHGDLFIYHPETDYILGQLHDVFTWMKIIHIVSDLTDSVHFPFSSNLVLRQVGSIENVPRFIENELILCKMGNKLLISNLLLVLCLTGGFSGKKVLKEGSVECISRIRINYVLD